MKKSLVIHILSCFVLFSVAQVLQIVWQGALLCETFYHRQVITEKSSETRIHLLMQGANPDDSGVYRCRPDNAPEARIKVHILKGE